VAGDRELDSLIDDENVIAHLFVAADRLARARTPREALDIAVEILHNLAGVHRYAVWLRATHQVEAHVVAPADPRFRTTSSPDDPLVARALSASPPGELGGALPVACSLFLDGDAVGAIEIRELVPQVGGLGRLQLDLLVFLSERLAPAMVAAGHLAARDSASAWAEVATAIEQGRNA
jgi:hypothetical protein